MRVGTGCRNMLEYTFPSCSSYLLLLLLLLALGLLAVKPRGVGTGTGTGTGSGSGGVHSTNPKQYIPGPHSLSFEDGHGALQLS